MMGRPITLELKAIGYSLKRGEIIPISFVAQRFENWIRHRPKVFGPNIAISDQYWTQN